MRSSTSPAEASSDHFATSGIRDESAGTCAFPQSKGIPTAARRANMSVDNTSRVDELVPSRYAVHVGDIEVLAISEGLKARLTRT